MTLDGKINKKIVYIVGKFLKNVNLGAKYVLKMAKLCLDKGKISLYDSSRLRKKCQQPCLSYQLPRPSWVRIGYLLTNLTTEKINVRKNTKRLIGYLYPY